jgi:DivIVA protein
MSDFERSGDRAGVTYDEPAKRRSPGTFFADLGDRLARGFTHFDRPQPDQPAWEPYEDVDQPTAPVAAVAPPEPSRKRFPTVLHGYDRDAVDDYIAGLEDEIGEMAAKLAARRSPAPAAASAVDAEITRVGEETSAILRVAHEQAGEITRRARVEADKCVADAAANAVKMTEDAKRKLRQLDTETDAVWSERMRLIEDARNVATSLFSLAEDACDRFPEDADRGTPTVAAAAVEPDPKPVAATSPPPGPTTWAANSGSPAPGPTTSPANSGSPAPGPTASPANSDSPASGPNPWPGPGPMHPPAGGPPN